MLKRLEQRNREIWQGRSDVLQDVTHTIGGVGVGFLLYPVVRGRSKTIGWLLVILSAALHLYADSSESMSDEEGEQVRERLEPVSS